MAAARKKTPMAQLALCINFSKLTPAEMRLVQAHRNCCDEVQDMTLRAMELHAKNPELMRYPPPPPKLRLAAVDGVGRVEGET